MRKPNRFVIICKTNVNFCTMSIWLSILYFVFNIFVYLFCLPNKYIYIYRYIYSI